MKYKFKVGDKIRLKDYSQYTDYKNHLDQVATITRIVERGPYSDFDAGIVWNDGSSSSVAFKNLLPEIGDWDE